MMKMQNKVRCAAAVIHACSTPTLNFSAHPFAHSEEQCPYLTPCRKYMHVIIQGICTFPK